MATLFSQPPPRVLVHEVALRDGLQNEARYVATDEKVALADRLSATGLAKIELTSFVSPRAVPQLRDAEELCRRVARRPGVAYSALVVNERGCERALAAGVDEINLVMSIGEAHNLANVRMTCARSLEQFRAVLRLSRCTPLRVHGTVATAFGCPFEGEQPLSRVLWAVEQYLAMGMHGVTLADTTGMADPRRVNEVVRAVRQGFPGVPLTLHFHDTRGMGLANVLAAVEAGADRFDAALGGIGGCPYAPGATGNVATEDLVHMLERCGIETGVDLDALLRAAREMPRVVGHEVHGQVARAGKATELHPAPQPGPAA